MARSDRRTTPAARRYMIRFFLGMALYMLALPLALIVRNAGQPSWIPLLITLPSVALITWAVVAYFREADEFEQRKLGESFTTAFAIGVPILLSLGLWEAFGGPRLSWMFAFIVMMAAWLFGTLVANLRYR